MKTTIHPRIWFYDNQHYGNTDLTGPYTDPALKPSFMGPAWGPSGANIGLICWREFTAELWTLPPPPHTHTHTPTPPHTHTHTHTHKTHTQSAVMRSFYVFFVVILNELFNKQSNRRRFEMTWRSCDTTVASNYLMAINFLETMAAEIINYSSMSSL